MQYEHKLYKSRSGWLRAKRRWARRVVYGYEWAGGWTLCLRAS